MSAQPNQAKKPSTRITPSELNKLLLDNQQLIWAIAAQSNRRRNKNFVNASIATKICKLQRNLLKLCKSTPSSAAADHAVVDHERLLFSKLYKKKTPTTAPQSAQKGLSQSAVIHRTQSITPLKEQPEVPVVPLLPERSHSSGSLPQTIAIPQIIALPQPAIVTKDVSKTDKTEQTF